MADETIKLPIHSALIPNFYRRFHCLAQDCRDNCCAGGWQIAFDKKDYLRLRRLDAPAELKARLEEGVRRERGQNHDGVLYGKFDLDSNSGRCPFLDPDGLCSIQRACGHEALPHVCTNYPRNVRYTVAAKEYTLSPSCEGVLQQLWDLPEGVEFVEDPLPKAEQRSVSVLRGESLAMYFAPIRGLCIDILQNRALPLTERMICLGAALQLLQKADWTQLDPDKWAEQIAAQADMAATVEIPGNRQMYLMQNTNVLDAIAVAEKAWTKELYTALKVERKRAADAQVTTTISLRDYEQALEQFQQAFSAYGYFFENLMVAVALYTGFPRLDSREALWESYVSLCSLYSFYRFASVLGCKDAPTKERLFHMIVMASRATLHNQNRLEGFRKELFRHDSSTLAHMAILLRG